MGCETARESFSFGSVGTEKRGGAFCCRQLQMQLAERRPMSKRNTK